MDEMISWLELVNLFQTFEGPDLARDKQLDIGVIRQILDEYSADE